MNPPKSLDFSVVRDRIYLNLLDFVSRNRRYGFPQKLFEIGDVVVGVGRSTGSRAWRSTQRVLSARS
ncbi:hypothetical protein [Thermogymnomonas acidicola]|uniref:hypothetical protein n=1 Tax=Thermogymnomonas acidicola TaxID=399579 RepID=UPI0009465E94|nr:hypothetical protein [Thermogymnomonas acidicola]